MSSTISTSTLITSSTLSSYSWPVTINTSGVVVTLGSDITLTSSNQYFIIGGSNIIFAGSNFRVYLSNIGSYPGLIQNLTSTNINISILNLSVVSNGSTLSTGSGWVCQSFFLNGTINFCKSNGPISSNSGGIIGQGSYNCVSTNNYASGSIGEYAGGIFGSYCVNCSCSESYTSGSIGDFAGGIFGFGTNYTSDGSSYSPTQPLDQSGNPINPIGTANNFGTVTTCTVTNCYSLGSIGSNAGGIFGYFAYTCATTNSYSVGSGTSTTPWTAGGIYAPNYYYSSSIYTPSITTCSASNCYTSGSNLALDGIYSFTGTNVSSNTKTSCFSEQYSNPCSLVQVFNNCNASTVLLQVGQVWFIPDLCIGFSPFILASFTRPLYTCAFKEVKHCAEKHSDKAIYQPSYYILDVNFCVKPKTISICTMTGKLNFNKVKHGDYAIRVLNGGKTYILSSDNVNYSVTYVDYYTCVFCLKSK
jgi:hypothetical protein